MKLKEIMRIHKGLVKQSSKVYTAKLGYAISKNMKAFRKAIEEYDENRLKICERYAEKDKDDISSLSFSAYRSQILRRFSSYSSIAFRNAFIFLEIAYPNFAV